MNPLQVQERRETQTQRTNAETSAYLYRRPPLVRQRTPLKWRFAGWLMAAQYYMLAG